MKYAFIFGTSIYLSEHNTVSYADAEQRTEFLKVLSTHNHRNSAPDHVLAVDVNINSSDDDVIAITGNQLQSGNNVQVKTEFNRVQFYRADHAQPVFDIHQLSYDDISGLSSHIVNEIEAQQPDAIFTIKGDFRVGGHRILVDNEKLYVDGDDYANGVTNAHEGVRLMPYGLNY